MIERRLCLRTICTAILLIILSPFIRAGEIPRILDLEERAEVMDRWLEDRLDTLIPELMREQEIDMWLLVAREYNEDPVLATMLPATWFSARRRTILLFFDPGEGQDVERLSVSRYGIGDFFKSSWQKQLEPDQWKRLADLIEERNPSRIGINISKDFALADGLTSTEHNRLREYLPDEFERRIVSAETLAVRWLETRTPQEMEVYPTLCQIAHSIIREGLSNSAITPGVTTTRGLEWWFRNRVEELDLATWFHPSVSVQRRSQEGRRDFADKPMEMTIRRGDLIHVDFGITYLGLNTDTQEHAYVLRPGEEQAPEGLLEALRQGNRLQDILTANFESGRTGNEVLRAALTQAKAEGIRPSIYTHPLGYHGHAAGPTIGLWDQQDGVPGHGDYRLNPNSAFSIELNVTASVEEWDNQDIKIMLEQDAFFDGETVFYLDGRQTEFHLIH